MSRIVINNQSKLPDSEVLSLVLKVIEKGKVSGKKGKEQYAYLTTFNFTSVTNPIGVSCDLNMNTNSFLVWDLSKINNLKN